MGAPATVSLAAIAAGLSRTRAVSVPSVAAAPLTLANVPGITSMDPSTRLPTLLFAALDDLLTTTPIDTSMSINVVLGWPDPRRPGSCPGPGAMTLADAVGARLGHPLEPEHVRCLYGGTAGGRAFVHGVARLENDPTLDGCLVMATDSLLAPDALRHVGAPESSGDGAMARVSVPGEAGVALWVLRSSDSPGVACVAGLGTSHRADAPDRLTDLRVAVDQALSSGDAELAGTTPVVAAVGPDTLGSLAARGVVAQRSQASWRGEIHDPSTAIGDVGAAQGLVVVALGAHLLTRHGEGGHVLCINGDPTDRTVATLLVAAPTHPTKPEDMPWAL